MDVCAKPRLPATAIATIQRPSREEAEAAVRTLLAWAGDDPGREGLLETPRRVTKAFGEFFAGYEQDPGEVLAKTFKEVGGYDDIVLVKDIPFSSHCEHHMVPFVGKVHIAYLPHDGVVGLSKLARLVEVYARRLQVQENMTAQIIDAVNEHLNPRAPPSWSKPSTCACRCAECGRMAPRRWTQRFTGVFAEERDERERFYQLLGRRG
jgi:GTP cyclohydrolase I